MVLRGWGLAVAPLAERRQAAPLQNRQDIAYANGTDDFTRIDKVPVFLGSILNVGHGGTYSEPNGGKAAAAVVAWLDWQLRHDRNAVQSFGGKSCGLCTDSAWSMQRKRIDQELMLSCGARARVVPE